MISKQWADKKAIEFDENYEQESHRFTNFNQCRSKEDANTAVLAVAVSLRAKTIMSNAVKVCCCTLKLSRAIRFILFLSTARLTLFFAIASPSLGCSSELLIASNVKYLSVDFTALLKTG